MKICGKKQNIYISLFLIFGIVGYPTISFSQLSIDSTHTVNYLVENILTGSGVTVSNIQYSGSSLSIGEFSNGNSTNIGLNDGILLSTGNVKDSKGPNLSQNKTTSTMQGSDPQLASLVPSFNIYDAAVLEFDFIPMSDTLKFRYVFASDEYPEWANTGYNDVFGFFVNGLNPGGGLYQNKNIALIPGTNTMISINSINNGSTLQGPCNNCNFYVDNTSGTSIEFDGFTTVLTSWILVTPCTSYHIKIAIGDVGDRAYDSGVFLEKHSFSSNSISTSKKSLNTGVVLNAIEGCNDVEVKFKLEYPAVIPTIINYQIAGTATNGVDFTQIPSNLTIPIGLDSATLIIHPINDGLIENQEILKLIVETNTCSPDTILIPFDDYSIPQSTIVGDTSLCIGDSTNLFVSISGGISPYKCVWNTSDTTFFINQYKTFDFKYYVTVKDACNSTTFDTAKVLIHPFPMVVASSADDTICQGGTTKLLGSGADNYNWSVINSSFNVLGDSIVVNPNSTTTYTLIGKNTYGCSDTTYKQISVYQSPDIKIISNDTSICLGDSINLTAYNGISYSWLTPITSGNVIHDKPTISKNYKVVGTDLLGCSDTAVLFIEVNNLPNISISADDSSFCMGDSTLLNVCGALYYTWFSPVDSIFKHATTVPIHPNASTIFTAKGTNLKGCSSFDTISIVVNNLPTINISPKDTMICFGETINIQSGGANSYTWNSTNNFNQINSNTILSTCETSAKYYVKGEDINGCHNHDSTLIVVSSIPSISSVDTSICLGDNSILIANAPTQGTSFIWNTGDQTQSINVNPLNDSVFWVKTIDSIGCVYDTSIFIRVNAIPSVNILPVNPTICKNQTLQIQSFGANSYQWVQSAFLNQTSTNTANVFPPQSKLFTVIGISSFGCKDTLIFPVNVNNLPNIKLNTHDTMVCPGEPIYLEVQGGNSYVWSPSNLINITGSNTALTNPSKSNKIIVEGFDSLGCRNTDTISIKVNPEIKFNTSVFKKCIGDSAVISITTNSTNAKFLWSTGETTDIIVVHPTISTNYSVTVTDTITNCSNSSNVSVQIYNRPPVSIKPYNDTICDNDKISLTASGASTYTWSPQINISSTSGSSVIINPDSNITYQVIGVDEFGCLDTAFANIYVLPSPIANINMNNAIICDGDSIQLTAGGGMTYSWTNNLDTVKLQGSSIWVNPNSSVDYQVVTSSSNGCKDSAFTQISVNPKPIIKSNHDSIELCAGELSDILLSGAAAYNWIPSSGLTIVAPNHAKVSPLQTTTYTVKGSTFFGCSDSIHIYVGIHSLPIVTVSPTIFSICPKDSLKISFSGADSYIWKSGVSQLTTLSNSIFIKPSKTTSYSLIGSNEWGCRDTAEAKIYVSPIPKITVSNSQICYGDSVKISVSTPDGNPTYLWNNGSTNSMFWNHPLTTTKYIVTATDTNGCVADTSIKVIVHNLPEVVLSNLNPYICPNDSQQLMAYGAVYYSWSPSAGLSNSNSNIVTVSTNTSMSYIVTGTDIHGCKDTTSLLVSLFPTPIIQTNITSDTICEGDSVQIIVSGGIAYEWVPANGLSSTINDTVWAKPSVSTQYRVIVSNNTYCRDTAFINIVVYNPAIISSTSPGICPGGSTTLHANTSISGTSFLWNTGNQNNSVLVQPNQTTNYSVTSTYPIGCSLVSNYNVIVYNDPNVEIITPKTTICQNASINLKGKFASSYNWSPSNTLSTASGDSIFAFPSLTTTYTVIGTSLHGCLTKDTIVIDLYAPITINVSPTSHYMCKGDSIQLLPSGGNSYSWLPSNSISSSASNSAFAKPLVSTLISVIGVDSNGCKDTAYSNITIDRGPSIQISPNNPSICKGDTVHIQLNGAQSYLWSPNTWISGSTSSGFVTIPQSNILYTIKSTNIHGCVSDTFVYVNVRRQPMLTINKSFSSICEGDSLKLEAGGAVSYNWTPSSSLSIDSGEVVYAKPTTTTTYSITGASTDGCYKTLTSIVNVIPKPILSISSSNDSICFGDTTSLHVTGATTYQWSPTAFLSNSNTATVMAFPNANTNYIVKGTNTFGCYNTQNIAIKVFALPNITISANDTSICFNDSVRLDANGASTYQWFGSNLSNNTGSFVYAKPNTSGLYSVKGKSINGCYKSASIYVNVNNLPALTMSMSNDTLCSGDSSLLSVLCPDSNVNYLWSNGFSNASIWVKPITNQIFKVYGTNTNNCVDSIDFPITVYTTPELNVLTPDTTICKGDSIFLSTQANLSGLSYLWNTGSSSQNILVNPNLHTTYTLVASNGFGCSDTVQTKVFVQNLPSVSVSASDSNICAHDTISLFANSLSSSLNYLWNNGNTVSNFSTSLLYGKYFTVKVTDSIGCSNKDSLFISVYALPVFNVSASNLSICEGDSSIISTISNNPNLSYNWNTGISLQSFIVHPTENTNYTVTATDFSGCYKKDSVEVIVNPLPIAGIISSNSIICKGKQITLQATSSNLPANYHWNTGSTNQIIQDSPMNNSNYSVTVTDLKGCKDDTSVMVAVYNQPIIQIQTLSDSICFGDTAILNALSTIPVNNYLWSTGDTTTQCKFTPINTSFIKVELIDSNGCFGSDSTIIVVKPRPSCRITSLSPICSNDSSLIVYTGNASANATAFWNFDGGNSNSINGIQPKTVKWIEGGNYFVELFVVENGCQSPLDSVLVKVNQSPIADFTVEDSSVCDNETATFISLNPFKADYYWHFGDKYNPHDNSNLANPVYKYTEAGFYDVSLRIVGEGGCNVYINKENLMSVLPSPHSGFSSNPSTANIQDPKIEFVNWGKQAEEYKWNFGDENSYFNFSNDKNPFHVYSQTGTFEVQLITTNKMHCSDTVTHTIEITDNPIMYIPNAFTPNADGTNDFFFPQSAAFDWNTYSISIYNRWGQDVYNSSLQNPGWDGTDAKTASLCSADVYVYTITIRDLKGKLHYFKGNVTLIR